jgi:hypothetical protein
VQRFSSFIVSYSYDRKTINTKGKKMPERRYSLGAEHAKKRRDKGEKATPDLRYSRCLGESPGWKQHRHSISVVFIRKLNVKVKKFNQARVNGGSNYDSLKVAKCLVI